MVELVPEVAALARSTSALERRPARSPDVRLVIDDGRRHLGATGETFDVIVSDLFIPWHAGGELYSLEMYATVARRLAPGGLFCQWLPLYQLTREEFEVIARTFLAVFPHVDAVARRLLPQPAGRRAGRQLAAASVDLERRRGAWPACPHGAATRCWRRRAA